MSNDPTSPPTPYTVSYSQHVREELRRLLERARAAGCGQEYMDAAKQIDERLRIFPQFGDPIIDLTDEKGTIRVGAIGPLAVRYAILEDHRLVMVVVPFMDLAAE